MLRSVIYGSKRLLHNRPRLYSAAYNLATFNTDYLLQCLQPARYTSAFGGLWTDRIDFDEILAKKITSGEVDQSTVPSLNSWRADGYLKVEGAIDHGLIDRYLAELETLKSIYPSPLLVTSNSLENPARYSPKVLRDNHSPRTVDDYFHSELAREILFQPAISTFLALAFERSPMLTQSLNFERGSQQALHQDTAFVTMNSPMKLIGVWIALEDVQPGTGELVYYPGSHRWPDFLFSGHFKHYDAERDGEEQLQQWFQWMATEAAARRVPLETFLPKKGDVLFWHAALIHGGALIEHADSTRHSLVGHYCPIGVRPLYHYYKPSQIKRYRWHNHVYCSSHYR